MLTFLYFLIFYWIFAHLLVFTAFLYVNKNEINFTLSNLLYFILFLFISGILLPILIGAHLGYLINKTYD